MNKAKYHVQLTKIVDDNFQMKLSAPAVDKALLEQIDTAGLKKLLEFAVADKAKDVYAKWFLEEGNYALTQDMSLVHLFSTISSGVNKVGQEGYAHIFTGMTFSQIIYSVYINVLGLYGNQPHVQLQGP